MPMSDLASSVAQFCNAHGLRMNTDLGQHFLTDESVLQAILDVADIQPTDQIVEIGPGIGILTKELLTRAASVTAIELDARLIPLLKEYVQDSLPTPHSPQLHIINSNALSVPFPDKSYKIVANIPYHITSPLLRHAFLEGTRSPTSLTLLIQREVAEKICDEHDRSLLTIIVGLFGTPRIVTIVPPNAFLPPPKVDSAVLHIDCFAEPKASGEILDKVFVLTKHAFSQKRKMLRNTLSDLPGGEEAMKKVGIDKTRRPQTLSVDEWIALARAFAH